MLIVLLAIVLFLGLISLFAFPRFSPIPYFPSNAGDMGMILDFLDLKNGQTVIDLGAGDGIVIFRAAAVAYSEGLDTKFIAVDINPVLVLIMNLRRLFHPNRGNITIRHFDFLNNKLSSLTANYELPTTFYLYISPWLLEKTLGIIKKWKGKKTIVSYFYPIKSLDPQEKSEGIHKIFKYKI